MKKKIILSISLIVVLGICISIAIFFTSGAETDPMKAYQTAAQLYKRICNADSSFDPDASDPDGQTVVGYYKDLPITRDQVNYKQAMDQINQESEKTEKETVFAVARDLYAFEQAKELGLYPSEEEIEDAFISETESFDANPEENMEFCLQIGFTRDELIAWMTQIKIESVAKSEFMAQILTSLQEEEEIEDEVLAELVQALKLSGEETDLRLTLNKLFDRYVILQAGNQITYVNDDGSIVPIDTADE